MKKNIAILATIFVFTALSLTVCDDPFAGNEGTVTINFGGGGRSASPMPAWPTDDPATIAKLNFKITLTSGGETITRETDGVNGTIRIPAVSVGRWNVEVRAYFQGTLYATGSGSVDVKAGQNNSVYVQMQKTLYKGISLTDGDGDPLTTHDFGYAQVGYGTKTLTVTVTNTGNQATGDLTVLASGTDFSVTQLTPTSLAVGQTGTFTVQPNIGLLVSDTPYTATVTVSDGDGVSASFDVIFKVTDKPVYDVIVAADPASMGRAEASPATAEEGVEITLTATAYTGYQFVNWTTTTSGVTIADTTSAETTFDMPASNVTIRANFEVATYTVIFKDGDEEIERQTVAHGGDATAPAYNPSNKTSGYLVIYDGWDKVYTNITADTTINAKWRAYAIDDRGPGGGDIRYVDPEGFTVEGYGTEGQTGYFATYTAYYIEVARERSPENLHWGSGMLINGVTTISTFPSSNWNSDEIALGNKIGNGRKDTMFIVAALRDGNGYAAGFASATRGGKDDWFLPSIGELRLLNLSSLSSSQRDSANAWFVGVGNDELISLSKSSNWPYIPGVIPIRAF